MPEVDAELRRRAFAIPGVEERDSALSLPGARSLWLADDVNLARPEVLQSGREFAHIHPNGSLHIWLPVDRAFEVAETRWGELHPWVGREDFWDGMALLYTPETLEEVDVIILLIVDAYNYVTGENVDPASVQ
ncbi:MAG: luciferase family protein [Actinomycetota bacterium]